MVDKDKLNSALSDYYKLPENSPIPPNSYITAAILEIVDGVGRKPQYRGHGFNSDMQSTATLKMLEIVISRKIQPDQNAFAYLNTVCVREFNAMMLEEVGHKAVTTRELLGYRASLNPHSANAKGVFVKFSDATKDVCEKYIEKKLRTKQRARNRKKSTEPDPQ